MILQAITGVKFNRKAVTLGATSRSTPHLTNAAS